MSQICITNGYECLHAYPDDGCDKECWCQIWQCPNCGRRWSIAYDGKPGCIPEMVRPVN